MVSFLHRWRYRDFTKMGRGIEARYHRCGEWWEPHIRCTKEFIAAHIHPAQSVAVLGAGRLYDIDLAGLLESFDSVHLFDLDATCVAEWKRRAGRHFGSRVIPHVEDITGCIEKWPAGLRGAQQAGILTEYLRELEAPEPGWLNGDFDTVISLNILGQIPLYWRDRVLPRVGELTESERAALEHSMGVLQEAHLRALTATSTRNVLLLTDTEYYFYTSSESEWRVEQALWGGAREMYQQLLRDTTSSDHETWMWHLVPYVVEAREEGEIHRVEALFCRGR